jgi:hypothetical protein
MEGSIKVDLIMRCQPVNRDKGKFFDRNSKSKGRSKSEIQLMRRCWKCDRVGNYKRDYNLKEI